MQGMSDIRRSIVNGGHEAGHVRHEAVIPQVVYEARSGNGCGDRGVERITRLGVRCRKVAAPGSRNGSD